MKIFQYLICIDVQFSLYFHTKCCCNLPLLSHSRKLFKLFSILPLSQIVVIFQHEYIPLCCYILRYNQIDEFSSNLLSLSCWISHHYYRNSIIVVWPNSSLSLTLLIFLYFIFSLILFSPSSSHTILLHP